MKMKHEVNSDLQLDKVLEIKNFFERRTKVKALTQQEIDLTPELLEKALATYDWMIIEDILEYARKTSLKPTTKCLDIMITNRAAVTQKAVHDAWARGSAVDPSYSIYALQAKTVKSLIELGADLTAEIINKSVLDDQKFGEYKIEVALSEKDLEPTSKALQTEFNRISEIRKNSRTLAQAFRTRTSLFCALPEELLHKIASLTGKNEDVIEENESDIKTAAIVFSKPN
ncbi:hypothetical protein [Legionella sp. WA2022007384]